MSLSRLAVLAAIVSAAAPLSGCGPYGLKGDRGLPPPPAVMPYTAVHRSQPDDHPPLKSQAERDRIQQNLTAAGDRLNKRRF